MTGTLGSTPGEGRCTSQFLCGAFLAGSKLFCLLQNRHLNHGGCRRIATAILIGRWQMRALWRALNLLYQLVCSAAHRAAIMAFGLAILSSHAAGDARFVCDDKMVKRSTFRAILMAPTY